MSNVIFPIGLPGEMWPVVKDPYFSTIVNKAASGPEVRIPQYPNPLEEFTLRFSVLDLSKGDFQTLWGFYVARSGPFDNFLFFDVTDNYTVTIAQQEGLNLPTGTGQNVIGTGDGSTTQFQLTRAFGGASQPVYAINGITATYAPPISSPFVNVFLAGSPFGGSFSVSSAGMLTFGSAPGLGVSIAADFSFFKRVRFSEDHLSYSNFVQNLLDCGSLKFQQVYA